MGRKRNENCYQNTPEHGKNYDARSMMHTFRLLDMAVEILETGWVLVRRPNRAELLQIRSGAFDYDLLLERAARKVAQVEAAALVSPRPDQPNLPRIEQMLVRLRTAWYAQK